MSCYKYWKKISATADSLNTYDCTNFKSRPLDEIIPLLDAIEVIAHDRTIDFDKARHILDNKKMNND